jgi:hypothetical protein
MTKKAKSDFAAFDAYVTEQMNAKDIIELDAPVQTFLLWFELTDK